jgi:hypothetical protein
MLAPLAFRDSFLSIDLYLALSSLIWSQGSTYCAIPSGIKERRMILHYLYHLISTYAVIKHTIVYSVLSLVHSLDFLEHIITKIFNSLRHSHYPINPWHILRVLLQDSLDSMQRKQIF